MLKNFLKYQSLGNDFIIFDWYKKPEMFVNKAVNEVTFPDFVKQICNRHFGVGADGVLILKGNTSSGVPEMLIFNADGSAANMCLNGMRCVAHHAHTTYNFPNQFKIRVGDRIIECFIIHPTNNQNEFFIKMDVGPINYIGEKCISISENNKLCGHFATINNPHFIVFEQKSLDWLAKFGPEISTHKFFENGTNVEFVWPSKNSSADFESIVYERGCGITLACSSGIAATAGTLFKLGNIKQDQEFKIEMPGGTCICSVSSSGNVYLSAEAKLVFSGIYSNSESHS